MSTSYTWGSAPVLSFTISDNISRDSGAAYSGYLTVTLGGCSGGSYFGYSISCTVDGETVQLKGNTPSTWSSGAYSHSFYISGSSTASSITITVRLSSNSGRSDGVVSYTTSIGSYSGDSGGGSSGGSTTAGASVPTLSKTSARLGETVTIYTNRQSTRYTHKITYSVGGVTGTIAEDVTASAAWAVPTSLIDAVTMAGTDCTITVATYYRNTLRGANVVHLTLYPPDAAAPTVSDGWVTVSRDNSLIPSVSAWVKGYSKAKITFNSGKVSGNYGATISKFSILYDGERTDAVNGAATTKVLSDLSAVILCTVTDSRGNTTTEAVTVTVQDYAPPTITNISVYRCDDALLAADEGTHIAARATAGCTSLGGANSVTLKAAYKAAGASGYGSEVTLQSGVAGMISGNAAVDTMQSYTVRLTATDRVGNKTAFEKAVPTKSVTFHLKNGGKGAAFGKYAEQDELLDCQWDANFAGALSIAGTVKVGGQTLADYIKAVVTPLLPSALDIDGVYPVGSIYLTVGTTDPAQLFAGTYWEKLEGRFLLGTSAGIVAGATGGEANVTLTVSEMPLHSHTGVTDIDGDHSHSFPGRSANGSSGPSAESFASSDDARTLYTDVDGDHSHSFTTNATGGGAAHNNMPPYIAVNMWKRIR